MKKLIYHYLTSLSDWTAQNLFHHHSLAAYFEPIVQWFKPGWRSNAYRASVKAITHVAADVVKLELQVSKSWPIHQAGQHVQLTLDVNGRLINRVFSISSSVQLAEKTQRIQLTIKQYSQGGFTPRLSDSVKIGDWLNISKPLGEFTLAKTTAPLVMVAGGSGITPFISLLQSHLAEVKQPVTLIYFAKKGQHLFTNELTALALQNSHFNCRLLTRETHGEVAEHLDLTGPAPYVMMCGPAALVDSTAQVLDTHQHPLSHRAKELFRPAAAPQTDSTQPVTIELLLNGLKKRLNLNQNNTLLTQMEQQGVAVSSGCRMGVCHQCQCLKRSGVVRDTRTGQLSGSGEQLIQLCVSQPLGRLELEL